MHAFGFSCGMNSRNVQESGPLPYHLESSAGRRRLLLEVDVAAARMECVRALRQGGTLPCRLAASTAPIDHIQNLNISLSHNP